MSAPDPRARWRITGIWLGLLVGLNLLLWAVLVLYVPRQKKTFDEYGLMLPALTKTVIQASHWGAMYWFVAAPTLVSAMAVGVLAGRHALRRPTAGTVFAWVCLFAQLAALAVIMDGHALATQKLAAGLEK